MLPTFVLIGAMKGGTHSLHRYLGLHPEITVSPQKELNFFIVEKNFSKGLEWYSSQFPEGTAVRGEASPNYSRCEMFAGVPERMHALLPDVKLLYVVRDPVERAISHYMHDVSRGRESRTATAAFKSLRDNKFVETGRYMQQLRQFLEFYRDDQIHVALSEDLLHRRRETLSTIFRFLEVDPTFDTEEFDDVHHRSTEKTRERRFFRAVRKVPLVSRLGKAMVPPEFHDKIKRTSIERPVLPEETLDRLRECYADDNKAFEQYLGRSLTVWY